MGEFSADVTPKGSSGTILRRKRTAVAAFRRDRRAEPDDLSPPEGGVPAWGRIVFRSGTITLR